MVIFICKVYSFNPHLLPTKMSILDVHFKSIGVFTLLISYLALALILPAFVVKDGFNLSPVENT